MGLNWERSNKQSRMWRNGFEIVRPSTPRSKPKKQVKTIGDAVLELQHLRGKRRTKAVKEILRNKRFRDLIHTEKRKRRRSPVYNDKNRDDLVGPRSYRCNPGCWSFSHVEFCRRGFG